MRPRLKRAGGAIPGSDETSLSPVGRLSAPWRPDKRQSGNLDMPAAGEVCAKVVLVRAFKGEILARLKK